MKVANRLRDSFSSAFSKISGQMPLLGGQIDQLLVVNADSESRRHGLADGLAAASELPPDIDDEFIFHSRGLFGIVRCRGRIHLGPEFTQLVGQHAEGHDRRQQV